MSIIHRLQRERKHTFLLGGFLLILTLISATFIMTDVTHAAPGKINYQGRLADATGTAKPDGQYNMKFRIYDAASGGTLLWSEIRETTDRVTVTDGQFNVQLGAVTTIPDSVFASDTTYFEVELPTPATATCSTSSCGTYTEGAMTPRQPVSSSAYAVQANNAGTLDGLDSLSFSHLGSANTYTSTNLFNGTVDVATTNANAFEVLNGSALSFFNVDTTNNTVQVGSSSADSTGVVLVLDTKNTSGDPTGVAGAMYYNSNLGKFRCYEGAAWTNCIGELINVVSLGSNVVNNNGTANTLADVTGLSFAVTSGRTYRFAALISYNAQATTTGSRWTISGPATTALSYSSTHTFTATALTTTFATAINMPAAANTTSLTTGNVAKIDGTITPSANGTVQVRFASEVASSSITALAGSTLTWW